MDNQQIFILHLCSAKSEKAFKKSHAVIQKHTLAQKFNVFYPNLVTICIEQTRVFLKCLGPSETLGPQSVRTKGEI